jgi:hypothetical protein
MTKEQRESLQEQYANQVIDGMSLSDLTQLAYEHLMESLDQYNDSELENEVAEFAPNLLED